MDCGPAGEFNVSVRNPKSKIQNHKSQWGQRGVNAGVPNPVAPGARA
jgi:hypothetical protein